MLNPLDAPRVVWCRMCTDDVERIGRLVDEVNRRATWFQHVKRTEVLRTLVRKGLDLAKARCFGVDYLEEKSAQKLQFKLSSAEFERVTRLQKDYVEGLANVAKPPLESLHRALIQLGLSEAERDDGFSSFAEEVKSSLWPRRASRRSGRGATAARPKDQHVTDAGDTPREAARRDPSSPVVPTIPPGALMHELAAAPAPSNDVDDGEQRALAGFGRRLLVGALRGSPALRVGFAPPPEAQPRLRALAVTALDAMIADDTMHDAMSVDAARVTGPPAGWMERVLHPIEEIEARGPTSRERPRRPPWLRSKKRTRPRFGQGPRRPMFEPRPKQAARTARRRPRRARPC